MKRSKSEKINSAVNKMFVILALISAVNFENILYKASLFIIAFVMLVKEEK